MGRLLQQAELTLTTIIDLSEADPHRVASGLAHIARNLRDQDRAELEAMHGLPPEVVIPQSVMLSTHAWIAEDSGGTAYTVFGGAPTALPGVGAMWLLGTDGVLSNSAAVARHTKPYLDRLQAAYPVLWNYVDQRNEVSLRWLLWAGFKVIGDYTAPSGHPFHIFARSAYV